MTKTLNEILAEQRKKLGLDDPPPTHGTAARKLSVVNNDNARAQMWVSRKIDAQIADLAAMPPDSGRNAALNAIAYSLGRLAPRWIDPDDIRDQLLVACMTNGLVAEDGQRQCEQTIHSGLTKGMLDPRDPPVSEADVDSWIASLPHAIPTDPGPRINPETGEVILEPLPRLDLGLLNQPCPEPEWLIEGRMTRQSLTLLGSKPGIGKSWTSLALALALATGTEWLGHPVPKPCRVLYIDVENGEVLARRRLQQLGADQQAIDGRLYYVTEAVMFPGGKDSRRYADTLTTFRPDLVIVDTLASAAPSAESDTESMSLFLSDVWHRARDSGAACLILAHLRKSQQGVGKDDPLDSFRGAGHLVGAASRAWLLDPRGPEKFVLRDVKTREFAAVPATRVLLQDSEAPAGALVPKLTAVVLDGHEDDEGTDPLIQFQHAALDLIDNTPVGRVRKADLIHLAAGLGLTEGTVNNHLTRLVGDGVMHRPAKGYYSRPPTPQLAVVKETS